MINDQALMDFFLSKVETVDDPIIIDVGANVGMFASLPYTVHAFEPNIEVLPTLVANAPYAIIYPFAISDKSGTATLNIPPKESGVATLGTPRRLHDDWEQVEVETFTLDEFEFPHVDFIKVDTEGHELNVLLGAEKLIARDHPGLLIEYTSLNTRQCGYEREEIVSLLKSWGYNKFQEVGREDLWAEVVDEPQAQYKYLATGTGGCGALSLVKAFIYAGYNAVHEGPFNFSGVYPDIASFWADVDMSASWMAAYHLARFTAEYPDVFIIHLVREPFEAVSSIYDAGMIYGAHLGGLVLFAHNALPTLHNYPSPWDKTAHFVIEWNERIEPYADLRWKIEDGIPALMAYLGIEWDESLDEKWHASEKEHPKLERGMIADELWCELEELRVRYGYA